MTKICRNVKTATVKHSPEILTGVGIAGMITTTVMAVRALSLIHIYVKYVRQQKFYGRYMDDWYIMHPSKEELENLLENVCKIAAELGIHSNRKKTRSVKISSKYKFLQIKYTPVSYTHLDVYKRQVHALQLSRTSIRNFKMQECSA